MSKYSFTRFFFNDNRDNRDNFCDYLFQGEAYCLYCRFNHLSCHANIVQRVKTCYKIKIDFRVLVCCFYGVLLRKQYPRLTTKPLLHSDCGTFIV